MWIWIVVETTQNRLQVEKSLCAQGPQMLHLALKLCFTRNKMFVGFVPQHFSFQFVVSESCSSKRVFKETEIHIQESQFREISL